ncbi:hypothetical protein PM082_021343 [Marasmius tenuissimus]|nr:hypothetical protein PM082_021343 [Marasmius tenuissimus]
MQDNPVPSAEPSCRASQRDIRGGKSSLVLVKILNGKYFAAGSYPRALSQFEKTLAQFQVELELQIETPSMDAQAVQEVIKYRIQYPNGKDRPVIWIDYTDLLPVVMVESQGESRRMLESVIKQNFHEHAMHVKAIGYKYGGCLVNAKVFWKGRDEY